MNERTKTTLIATAHIVGRGIAAVYILFMLIVVPLLAFGVL